MAHCGAGFSSHLLQLFETYFGRQKHLRRFNFSESILAFSLYSQNNYICDCMFAMKSSVNGNVSVFIYICLSACLSVTPPPYIYIYSEREHTKKYFNDKKKLSKIMYIKLCVLTSV